jgi:predicted nucleic-acid-binding protein
MIGLDTNVVVRYVMQDDAAQSPQAARIIENLSAEAPGFISLVSVIELFWVFTSCYALKDAQAAQAIELMLRTRHLVIDRAQEVHRALRRFKSTTSEAGNPRADFADCLIQEVSASVGCDQVLTFDKAAAKHTGMALAPTFAAR